MLFSFYSSLSHTLHTYLAIVTIHSHYYWAIWRNSVPFVIPSFPSYRYPWRQKNWLPNQKILRYSFLRRSQELQRTVRKLIVTLTRSPWCRYYHSVHSENGITDVLLRSIAHFALHLVNSFPGTVHIDHTSYEGYWSAIRAIRNASIEWIDRRFLMEWLK